MNSFTSTNLAMQPLPAYLADQLNDDYVVVGPTAPMTFKVWGVEISPDDEYVIMRINLSWRYSVADPSILLTAEECDTADRGVTWEYSDLPSVTRFKASIFDEQTLKGLAKWEETFARFDSEGKKLTKENLASTGMGNSLPWVDPGEEGIAFYIADRAKGLRMSCVDLGDGFKVSGKGFRQKPDDHQTIERTKPVPVWTPQSTSVGVVDEAESKTKRGRGTAVAKS